MLAFMWVAGIVNLAKLQATPHALEAANREHKCVLKALFSFAIGGNRNVLRVKDLAA